MWKTLLPAGPVCQGVTAEGTLLQKAYHLDDGTVAPSAWTVLAEALGKECLDAENETKRRWNAKEYPCYLDWMSATIDLHKRYGLTEEIFRKVVDSVKFMPNSNEALQMIHGWGSVSVLITGGFKALADRVQREMRIHHAFAACEYFFSSETGAIDHFNLLPADEQGKVDFMNLMCREYRVDPKDCAFVGDGKNDVPLARAVGFSVAFNAQTELEQAATVVISQPQGKEDFMAVVDSLSSKFTGKRN